MPRRYSRKPAYRRRAPKRYGKKYGRRRWKNKRFSNGINQLSMRATIASRILRVKLPWVKTFTASVATSSSSTYVFQGNGLIPYTAFGQTGAQNNPAPGDLFPAGAIEYSNFYDKYFINGSSINIEAVSTNSQALAASPLIRAVLIAVPFTLDYATVTEGEDQWQNVITQLNGYTYEQLLAWQFAKWRMLGTNTGGASRLRFKMFRKTKSVCGIKDLRDNDQFSGRLPDGSTVLESSANSNAGNNPEYGFMYYLRFFNADATTAAPLQITVRMKLYLTMTSREFNPIQTAVAPP